MPFTTFAGTTKAFEDAIAQAKQQFESVAKAQQAQFEKVSAQLMKGYEEFAALSKGNVDAFVQSGGIVAKGAELAGKQVAAFTQSALEKQAAAGKALLTAKSVREVIDLQSSFAKQSLETAVAESTKLQELSAKVASEAAAPIAARLNATFSGFAKPAAA